MAEGPWVSFGIHMSTDLSQIRGFSIGVGLELGQDGHVGHCVTLGTQAENRRRS